MAVRNAALAVDGLMVMPICCAAEAANRKVPQTRPAARRGFCSDFSFGQP